MLKFVTSKTQFLHFAKEKIKAQRGYDLLKATWSNVLLVVLQIKIQTVWFLTYIGATNSSRKDPTACTHAFIYSFICLFTYLFFKAR